MVAMFVVNRYLLHKKIDVLTGLLGSLLMLFSLNSYPASLVVSLDKKEAHMGKYFLATISYRGDYDKGDMNLSDWQESFHVDMRQSDTSSLDGKRVGELADGQVQMDTQVRLYPRYSGKLTLPSIAYGGAIAKSQRLLVNPSVRNNVDGTPVLQPMKASYWADESILITLDVPLHDKRNNVIANDFETKDFLLRSMKPQHLETTMGDIIRLQWVLLTSDKGLYTLELPSVQQRGRGRFRYYLPTLKINVLPLPAYIPATVPVGQITLQSQIIYPKKQSAMWLLKIQNSGRIPARIEGLQTFYDDVGISSSDVELQTSTDEGSQQSIQQIQINIPEWNLNKTYDIKISYFDTATGRLTTLQHTLPSVWNIPSYAQRTGVYTFILLMIYAGYWIERLAQSVREWRRFRLDIKRVTSAGQLRKLLLRRGGSIHLTEWASVQQGDLLQRIAVDLNAVCFDQKTNLTLQKIQSHCLLYFTFSRFNKSSHSRKSRICHKTNKSLSL